MKIRVLAALVSLAVLILQVPFLAGQLAGDEPRFHVRIAAANASTVASLEIAGYDVLAVNATESTVDLVVTRAEWSALEQRGLSVVVIERARPLAEALQGKTDAGAAPAKVSTGSGAMAPAAAAAVPAPTAVAASTYLDLDEVLLRMHAIALAHPAIAQVVDLTETYNTPPTSQGRHMYALKISDNVGVDEDETAMLILATHHAREITTPLIPLLAADRLTAFYGIDPLITAAVNGHEFWIAPVWNPDGYNHVFTADNFWRKNRRVFATGVGVDQNRNYPQGWATSCAGSTSAASDTYKGPSAASEPETQTLMTWSQAERFAKVIDYHSYGREVLYAYRCLGHPFASWMQQEAAALSLASGYGGATRIPSAEGEHYQWQLAKMGAYAFLIETHTEFQPSYESGLAEALMVWPGILRVIDRPISIRGHVTDAATGAPLIAGIELLNVGFSQGETNASGGEYGAYHMFLPPGIYNVRFSAPGYAPVVSTVTVTATSSTVRDIELSPTLPEVVVFSDDFETDRGWTTNPNGTDTATSGQWERGNPETTTSTGTKQLGTTVSGVNDLVTGRLAGTTASAFDIDTGSTSVQSPAIVLPSGGNLTLTFSYYLAHTSNASTADYLRVTVVGATNAVVLQELGAADNDDAVWTAASANLSAFAGQTIRIRIDAADAATASTVVEAGIDDVRVTRANGAPVAVNDTATTAEDTAATIAVLANDSDPNGDTLSVTATTQGAHGAVTLVSGIVRYTPAANYAGPDSFTYTISDGNGVTDTGTVAVTVTPVNDNPVAVDDTATVAEDSTGNIVTVLANDTFGPDTGETLSVTAVAQGEHGTVTLVSGVVRYAPEANYGGSDTFTYTLSDGNGGTATGTVAVTVTPVNDNPVAVNDAATMAEDSGANIVTVLANDTFGPDTGEALSVTAVAQGEHGTVTLVSGVVRYAPAANYAGSDAFTYTLSDDNGGTATGTVAVTVTPVNDNPVAVNDTATVLEDSTGNIVTVLGNDTDVDAATTLTATLGVGPSNGTVTLNANGSFSYTPAGNFNGTDSFTYTASDGTVVSNVATVTVAVTSVNDAPVATNDAAATTEEAAVGGNVLGNDTDVDTGTTLAASLAAGPTSGTVTLNADGSFTYAPNTNFAGTDTFTYTASDGATVSNIATVTVAVTGVNDAPVAANDAVTTPEDAAVSGNVLGNDADVDTGTTLTATLGMGPSNGTVTLNADGSFSYTPAGNFNGTDSFTYTASDGTVVSNVATVTVAVTAVNDAPVATNDAATTTEEAAVGGSVLGNDTDVDTATALTATLGVSPANGTVTLASDGSFTYTPAVNFNGTDSFTYTASDGATVSNLATVTVAVTGVNDAPVAANDAVTTPEDAAVSGNVLGNDADVDTGTTLAASLGAGPTSGVVTLSPDGSFTYTPNPNFSGSDSFTYTASDGTAVSNLATVTIAVTDVNDAPVATNDAVTTLEDVAVSGTVLGNDADVDAGTTLAASLSAGPTSGTVTISPDGSFTYTPNSNFSGSDSFTYTASDGEAVSNVATVSVTVTGVNDAPVAVHDTASTTEEAAVSGTVLGNDTDPDTGTTLSASLAASPANGTVTLALDGSFTYTPNANFSGSDSFTYTASDGTAVSNLATVTIAVTDVNDAPVAASDAVTTPEDVAVSGTVLGNDADVDAGTTLAASLSAGPTSGTVTLSPDGSFTYTPNSNFSGSDSFTYTASDGVAVSNVATVSVTVTGVNDTPVAVHDTASTTEEAAVSGTVLGNDTDPDTGTTLSASLAATPANGTVTLALDGSFTYTPNANFSGSDSFTYTASDGTAVSNLATVTIAVTGVNDAPVAVDDAVTTAEDTVVAVPVVANDTDVDGDSLMVISVSAPANGSAVTNQDGTIVYTPGANYSGSDSFTYTLSDLQGGTATATVTIAVTAVNDAPVAVPDAATTTEETAVSGTVLGNDTDVEAGATLTATLGASPANGALTLAPDGSFTYTPAANFSGTDSFTYTASDGTAVSNVATVTLTVTGVNDAPIAANDGASTTEEAPVGGHVLGNDSDVDTGTTLTATLGANPTNGTLTLASDGSFTYTPAANFNGTDTFTYTASDGTAVSNVATVTMTVTGVNDAPVAAHDAATTTEEAPVSGTVLGNDTDVDTGTTLTASLGASPANGTVTLASDGAFTYTPAVNFNGTDSFTYTASDGTAVSNVATVTMTVTSVNDAPVAANDTASTTQGTAVGGSVLGNDTDVDAGTTLTATLGASPANGAVTLNAAGSFTYTPNATFSGTDSFTYTASDGTAASNVATVTITVTGVIDPVVFSDDFETNSGWSTNPNGTDTAATGQWERGDPQATTSQLGTTVSGVNALVTGRLAGTSVGSFDVDEGATSIQSPAIVLPSGGNLTLTFSYYLAHLSNSSTADYLRVTIVGGTTAVVFQELGAANDDNQAWSAASVNLNAFAGQTIRIRIDAADAASPSLVEAAIDDVRIVRQ